MMRMSYMSSKPFEIMRKVYANGNNSEFLRILNHEGIKCSKKTLEKLLDGKYCEIDAYNMEKIINFGRIPSKFYFDPSISQHCQECSIIDENLWLHVEIREQKFVEDSYLKCNRTYEQTDAYLGTSKDWVSNFLKKSKREDYPQVKISRFIAWMTYVDVDESCYLYDKNEAVPESSAGYKIEVSPEYEWLVADNKIPYHKENIRLIQEKQKYEGIKKQIEDEKKKKEKR